MTAVEWFVREIAMKNNDINFDFWAAVKQAKEMEKQQIIESYRNGRCDQQSAIKSNLYNRMAEQYYNETFKMK